MNKRVSTVLGLGALAVGLSGALASPSFAASSSSGAPSSSGSAMRMQTATAVVSPQSCQAANATAWLFTSDSAYGYDCTGTAHPNVSAYRFDAGGWSGYLIDQGGSQRINFCDWHEYLLSGVTTTIYFSPTKESWC